jgi:murein DD-endopeptidase MepM/ murein hydrolase activator NlpD
MNERQKELIKKLNKKYRVIIYNDQSYEEVWSGIITRSKIFTYLAIGIAVFIVILILALFLTPINRLLPAYANSQMQQQILENARKLDSLEQVIKINDQYSSRLRSIFQGNVPREDEISDTIASLNNDFLFTKSKHDSILRRQIEEEERFNLSLQRETNPVLDFSKLHFFMPVKGIISNNFNREERHYGIDIVAEPNNPIMATLDGTVIGANWTLATGYVIEIQHDNNLISVYKHNAALLKQVGDQVKAGETIAIMGNTGEYSTGPHLHFELWHNGTPLNPVDYIVF